MNRQTDDGNLDDGENTVATNDDADTVAHVHLYYDETAIMETLRGQGCGAVPLRCDVRGGDAFVVNASIRPRSRGRSSSSSSSSSATGAAVKERDVSRAFFYLNGLVRAIVALRVRMPTRTNIHVHTRSAYLVENAKLPRIARWKKRGFRGADGRAIKHRTLWEEFWALTKHVRVTVCPHTHNAGRRRT